MASGARRTDRPMPISVEDMIDDYLLACAAFDVAIERVHAAIQDLPE